MKLVLFYMPNGDECYINPSTVLYLTVEAPILLFPENDVKTPVVGIRFGHGHCVDVVGSMQEVSERLCK